MKYKINYGNQVAVLPRSALDALSRAGEIELKVLLCLCASEGKADAKKLSKQTGAKEEDVRSALAFWRGTGVIEPDEKDEKVSDEKEQMSAKTEIKAEGKKPEEEKKPEKKIKSANELPHYSSEELAGILENRGEIVSLINECQNIMGKVFNVKEISVIIGLLDYLGLDSEYVLVLMTYCVAIGKKSLHYVETTAFSLYDAGITEGAQLAEELRKRELAASSEGQIRKIFGTGSRALTSKEKKLIYAWLNDMKYDIEIITKAYEVAANATGKASFPYTNAVLERWNAEGLRTIADIEAADKEKAQSTGNEGSFDTDDFFAAAVRRSLDGEALAALERLDSTQKRKG